MPPPGLHPLQIGGDEGAGDADVLGLSQKPVGVAQLEGKAQDGADRRQRDVALGPVEPDAEHLFALPLTLADDPFVHHRRGVGARFGTGQPEGRKLAPVGEAWQPVVFLFVGAELMQQFAGTK